MTVLKGQSIIAGEYRASGVFQNRAVNPATGETIGPAVTDAVIEEIDEAVRAAASVFGDFRKIRCSSRSEFLYSIIAEIELASEEIVTLANLETGLPESRLYGELARTTGQIRMFAELISNPGWQHPLVDTAEPERQPSPKPDLRRTNIPLGPVAVFGAGNFPLAFSVAGGDTISALAAGCPVIYKAHPGHPGTSELVCLAINRAIKKCGLPAGIFSMLFGASEKIGAELVSHPLIKAAGFTGSFAGGKALYDIACHRAEPIPFYAEMGSVNPVFILPVAMRESGAQIAGDLFRSVTLGVGQFCTKPGLFVFIENDDSNVFIELLSALFSKAESGIMLSAKNRTRYLNRSRDVLGMNVIKKRAEGKTGTAKSSASALLLTVSARKFIDNPDLQEEIFGPAVIGIAAANIVEMYEVASILHGQLTASVHWKDRDTIQLTELISLLEEKAGRIISNGFPTGVEVCKSMNHGGPFPASSDSHYTSVGAEAIWRWLRPVSYQSFPPDMLPDELK